MSLPLISYADIHKKDLSQSEPSESIIDTLVWDVLKNTELSLSLVESNAQDSLQHVENALASIREIKKQLSADTHIDNKSPLVVGESKEYWFLYPRLSEDILNNKVNFPTLHSKLESGIVYRGKSDSTSKNEEVATYFDYAFAYASLKMAREALTVTNYREAKSTLTWVFDAIYISPDFYVADYHDEKVKIDNLLNINGEFPRFSNRTQ
jgi:hypothetical protein